MFFISVQSSDSPNFCFQLHFKISNNSCLIWKVSLALFLVLFLIVYNLLSLTVSQLNIHLITDTVSDTVALRLKQTCFSICLSVFETMRRYNKTTGRNTWLCCLRQTDKKTLIHAWMFALTLLITYLHCLYQSTKVHRWECMR